MHNLLDPAILFFAFGVIAGALKSNLEIPPAIAKFLSLYLLMALGLKGGFALAKSGLNPDVAVSLAAAMLMAVIVPTIGYHVLKRYVSKFDAAAVAASYGSVSAVTFVTAMQYLEANQMAFGGHMAVAMVLMESPAIIMAVLLANSLRHAEVTGIAVSATGNAALTVSNGRGNGNSLGKILHESFTDGAHLLLLGSIAVGLLSGQAGEAMMKPFSGDLFKGMLAFFLLDMGLLAARNMGELRGKSPMLLTYAILGPLVHAGIALAMAWLLDLPPGDGALLMVLAASASYIAVPAVVRHAIPEANPSLFIGMSLGLTFPFNILVGIPLYTAIAGKVLGSG